MGCLVGPGAKNTTCGTRPHWTHSLVSWVRNPYWPSSPPRPVTNPHNPTRSAAAPVRQWQVARSDMATRRLAPRRRVRRSPRPPPSLSPLSPSICRLPPPPSPPLPSLPLVHPLLFRLFPPPHLPFIYLFVPPCTYAYGVQVPCDGTVTCAAVTRARHRAYRCATLRRDSAGTASVRWPVFSPAPGRRGAPSISVVVPATHPLLTHPPFKFWHPNAVRALGGIRARLCVSGWRISTAGTLIRFPYRHRRRPREM